jgi:Tripartite tricarboxylate transporter TctB family
MKIVDQKNFATGLLYMVLGAAFAIGATRYQIGTAARMGPGYFPLGVGLALFLVGLAVFGAAILRTAAQTSLGTWPLSQLAIVLVSVVLFGLLIEPMGLLIAIPVLIGVSSLAHHEFSWRTMIIAILVLVPLAWAVFVLLLGLQFQVLPYFLRP